MFDESINKILEEGDLVSLVGRSPLVPFDLFWVKRDGKRVLLKNRGDLSSRSELERWTSKDLTLEHNSTLNHKWLEEGLDQLNSFFNLQEKEFIEQKEIQLWRKDFLNWIAPSVWDEQVEVSRLDICFLMGTAFYSLSEEEEELFLNFPIEIQRRNYLVASFASLLAIVVGYTDSRFLSDYFKVLLFLDFPFCKNIWSESEKNYLTQEWSVPGLGKTLSADIKDRVLGLYHQSTDGKIENIKKNLRYRGLVKYLTWSFERANGEGPLWGVRREDLGDLDILTIFVNHSFSYQEDLKILAQRGILKQLFEKNNEFKDRNLKKRFEVLVHSSFGKAQELMDGYLQIVGL